MINVETQSKYYSQEVFEHIFIAVTCLAPDLENGRINYDQGDIQIDTYPENTMATFTCDDGYSLSGPSSSICQHSRTWDPQPPTCGNEIKVSYLHKTSFHITMYVS